MSGAGVFDYQALRLVALAVSLAMASSVLAQSAAVPNDILSAESLTDEQKATVKKAAEERVKKLAIAGSPADAGAARAEIIEPLESLKAKAAFKVEYTKAVAESLTPALEAKDPHVRFVAMLVLGKLGSPSSLPLYVKSLNDDHPGVRYLAAKGVADAIEKVAVPDKQQEDLLAILKQRMAKKDEQAAIYAQMGRIFNKLTIQPAQAEAIKLLRAHVLTHRAGINSGIQADLDMLASLFDAAQQPNVNEAALKEVTLVAAQFLTVVSEQMAEGEVDDSLHLPCQKIVELIDKVFAAVVLKFDPAVKGPPLASLAKKSSWSEVNLNALEWVGTADDPGLLTSSRIAIPHEQLALPALPKPLAPKPRPEESEESKEEAVGK